MNTLLNEGAELLRAPVDSRESNVEIEYSEKDDPREEIFKFIVKSKWTLLKMNPKSDSLEDIFRKLTGKNI